MIRQFDIRASRALPKFIVQQRSGNSTAIDKTVSSILRRVRDDGDDALRFFTRKFDGVRLGPAQVPEQEIKQALRNADRKFVRLLSEAARNIRSFHERQLQAGWRVSAPFGSNLRQRYLPVDSAGVYVPGGKAAYPSTVLMNVIPAQVAGVGRIAIASPPDQRGKVHCDVLTAAAVLGIATVYRIGGAQAIAAFAYGTASIPAVDVIVGPGNIYVATAKKLVYGKVGIDGIAGPSEVVIFADESARPDFVASDMLAQAEHDQLASSILVTPSAQFAADVKLELRKLAGELGRKNVIETSLRKCGAILIVRSLTHGAEVVNMLAPEHLEIVTKDDEAVLKKVRHAGSIFIGSYSPVALGDYFAGPNHVLPTERTSRFSSPLSVDTFMKKSSVVRYSRRAMEAVSEKVALFAEHEGLTAHALSARLRGKRGRA